MGIILFNKPSGVTSFDALRDIKRALRTGKVGHTGTLDKFAQGLLVVLASRALKLSRWFSGCDKKYIGKIQFGIETDTLDPEGEPIAQAPLPTREQVENALSQFRGDIMQAPPLYSAIHINGKRASQLARAGKQIEMKKRSVHIFALELRSWDPPFAEIFVHCSSGTYIRSLARDIALAAGSRAHLTELTRTHVAGLKLSETLEVRSVSSDKLEVRSEKWQEGGVSFGNGEQPSGTSHSSFITSNFSLLTSHLSLIPVPITKQVLKAINIPCFDISSLEAEKVIHGKPLEKILNDMPFVENETLALFCEETLVAVVEKDKGLWMYGCVF
jgi:tRNA pseudouridine55 synthase